MATDRFIRALCGAALATAYVGAQAQPHEKRVGAYVVRSSTVSTEALDEGTARAHGIHPAPNRAVINVTVLRDTAKGRQNVRATVSVSAADLTGRRRDIDMRPSIENERASYFGTFDFLPREVLTFRVVAVPEHGAQPLTLTFRDRMWR